MKLKVCFASLLFCTNAVADFTPPTCPSVDSLKTVKFNRAFNVADKRFVIVGDDNFSTPQHWYLSLRTVFGQDEMEAITRANELVKKLNFARGPYTQGGCASPLMWTCKYEGDGGMIALATTSYKTS